jgi:hypothetical protein
MSRTITSVQGLLRKAFQNAPGPDETLFYRGHADRLYKLEPSVFRDHRHRQNEHEMFNEMMAANPGDFTEDKTTFDKLVRMQHYSLPTRLLDITSNPLMALYFACAALPGTTGEVVILKVQRKVTFFCDGDTTSVIANLAHMDTAAKKEFAKHKCLAVEDFNALPETGRLLHFIREEKPYFQPLIVPNDLERIICVISKMSNDRIISQAGAFLLFGNEMSVGAKGVPGITIDRVLINGDEKPQILKELDALNIKESTVFPYIENSAKYIKERYKTIPIVSSGTSSFPKL